MTKEQKLVTIIEALKICTNLFANKEYDKCLNVANTILKSHPDNVDARFVVALVRYEQKDYNTSEKICLECIKHAPNSDQILFLLGRIKKEKKYFKEAIHYYEKAIKINPCHIAAINNVANIYNEVGNNDKAIHYLQVLAKKGIKEAFLFNNMSLIYKRVGMLHDAINHALKAIEIKPDCFEAHHNAGLCYILLAQNKLAIKHLEEAIKIDSSNLELYECLHDLYKKTCDWQKRKSIGSIIDKLRKEQNKKHLDAENIDYKNDELIEQYIEVSREHTSDIVSATLANYSKFTIAETRKDKNKKLLKIGYISSDIKDHPVAHLMRGVFKNHDKSNVETYLYSFSPTDKSGYQDAISKYVDNFIDINALSNYETAKRIFNDEIDVLIDLNGHTGSTKLDALALKPAPIQVNYLGYIGTMGAEFIDYIITDKIVTPADAQKYYDEKFVYMPDCYQANDNNLEISDEIITKESEGLPNDKFVFCSFNQTYKIEPLMFETWMNILKRVPDSVLWLYCGSIHEDDSLATENLQKEAQKHGIETERLIFAKPMAPIERHLRRTALADLALDTRLYNGGTVTSQTLWAGVPVITLQGNIFQSRMASSILNSIGLSELVTKSLNEYEDLAVELASSNDKLKDIKSRLQKNKHTKPLFDTELFTSNLEIAYRAMWENYCDGNQPKQIDLSTKQQSLPI